MTVPVPMGPRRKNHVAALHRHLGPVDYRVTPFAIDDHSKSVSGVAMRRSDFAWKNHLIRTDKRLRCREIVSGKWISKDEIATFRMGHVNQVTSCGQSILYVLIAPMMRPIARPGFLPEQGLIARHPAGGYVQALGLYIQIIQRLH